jgi:hypothetical protein
LSSSDPDDELDEREDEDDDEDDDLDRERPRALSFASFFSSTIPPGSPLRSKNYLECTPYP